MSITPTFAQGAQEEQLLHVAVPTPTEEPGWVGSSVFGVKESDGSISLQVNVKNASSVGGSESGSIGTSATPNVSTIQDGTSTNKLAINTSGQAEVLLDGAAATSVSQTSGLAQDTNGSGSVGFLSSAVANLRLIAARLAASLTVTVSGTAAVSAASLPLPSGASQDGTDATGVTQLTGGVGIRGWLSGLFSLITSVITAVGTSATKAITVQGAATGVSLPAVLTASSAAIGQVGGKTTTVDFTPTITASSAYTAGYEVGGLLTFSNALSSAGTGILQSITIKIKSQHSEGFKLYLFKANPSSSTWTDKTAPSINAADLPSLVGMYPLTVSDNGLGSMSIYNLDGIGKVLNPGATTLYGVLVTTSTPTFSSTTDLTVSIGVLQD